jgi:hypothetical protein
VPVNERLFASARLTRGHRRLHADRALVQVAWAEGAGRFDLKSADVVATAVADVEVPANACPLGVGQLWELEADDPGGTTRLEVLAVRLVEVRPGPVAFRRRYTWQFLVVRKPPRDPCRLFPRLGPPATVGEIPEGGEDVLGDLKRLLSSEIADAAVARFNAEGGFRLHEV